MHKYPRLALALRERWDILRKFGEEEAGVSSAPGSRINGTMAMKHLLLFSLFFAVLSTVHAAETPRHVFLFLAEGMDSRHLALGRQAALRSGYIWFPEGIDEQNKRLVLADSFGSGRAGTKNSDGKATDTEAAATAVACGVKTKNGYLGAGPAQERLKSLAILAKEAGWKVALLSTGPINRGPSAAFFAHVADGSKAGQIALEMHLGGIDFFSGETLAGSPLERAVAVDALRNHGYSVLIGERDLISYNGSGKIFCRTSERLNAQERAADKDSVSLARQVESALSVFGDQDSFFILAEGSGIGGKNGTNDTAALLAEMDEFNEALGKAFDFEKKHPASTLILVVSTHASGRMEFLHPDKELTPAQIGLIRKQTEPLSAIAARLKKLSEEKREKAAGDKQDPKKLGESFSEALNTAIAPLDLRETDVPPEVIKKLSALWKAPVFDPDGFLRLVLAERDRMAGIRWTREVHRENDTFVRAFGVGASLFNGSYENTEIFRKLTGLVFPSVQEAKAEVAAPETPSKK